MGFYTDYIGIFTVYRSNGASIAKKTDDEVDTGTMQALYSGIKGFAYPTSVLRTRTNYRVPVMGLSLWSCSCHSLFLLLHGSLRSLRPMPKCTSNPASAKTVKVRMEVPLYVIRIITL